MLFTSGLQKTLPGSTLQNIAIFCRISAGISRSVRQIRMSGWTPISRSFITECCVGLVFTSPAAAMYGSKRQVDVDDVLRPGVVTHLPDRLEERQRLDVAHRAAHLDDDRVVPLGGGADDRLDLVGDVRNHLDRLPEVLARVAPSG